MPVVLAAFLARETASAAPAAAAPSVRVAAPVAVTVPPAPQTVEVPTPDTAFNTGYNGAAAARS